MTGSYQILLFFIFCLLEQFENISFSVANLYLTYTLVKTTACFFHASEPFVAFFLADIQFLAFVFFSVFFERSRPYFLIQHSIRYAVRCDRYCRMDQQSFQRRLCSYIAQPFGVGFILHFCCILNAQYCFYSAFHQFPVCFSYYSRHDFFCGELFI